MHMSVAYDARTALVVVDVQNDFADPAGSLSVPGADKVIAAVNEEIAAASAAGSYVVYTRTGTRRARRTSSPTADRGPCTASATRGAPSSTPTSSSSASRCTRAPAARTATPASR